MSEEIRAPETKNGERSEGAAPRERGRDLPRLFGEMGETPSTTRVETGAGAAGGSEGAGVEGGAPREELWGILTPSEAAEVGRETGLPAEATRAGAGRRAEPGGEGVDASQAPYEAASAAAPGASSEGVEEEVDDHAYDEDYVSPALAARRKGSPHRKLRGIEVKLGPAQAGITAAQRLLILDTWQRSGLTARAYGEILGLSHHTLYAWRRRFEELGPAGLDEKPRGSVTGSRLPEVTRRAIVMMKKQHPEWGSERIHDMLMRSAGFTASAGAIVRVLREEGYESVPLPTHPHPPAIHRFERAG